MNYTILFMCVRLNVNNGTAYDTPNEVKYVIQEFPETMHENATAARIQWKRHFRVEEDIVDEWIDAYIVFLLSTVISKCTGIEF